MTSNSESKSSHLLIGLAVGAIGGLIAAILAHRETREALRERSEKSLDYLNQQAGKLRETADVIVQQGKEAHSLQRLRLGRSLYGGRKAGLSGRQARKLGRLKYRQPVL